METSLMNYFVFNDELRSTCDFNPDLLIKGKGIYEVCRVINGIPLFLNEHIERYYQSLKLGKFKPKLSRSQLIEYLKSLIESNRLKQGNIQFEQLKINGIANFIAWVTPAIYPSAETYQTGVNILTLNAVRELPQLKSINLPAREKANKLISDKGIFEVLLVDDNGTVTEGSRSNIFFVLKNELFTTPLSLILEGITRSKVISLAESNGIKVNRLLIPGKTINRFEAAFLTSTSMKVLPVSGIDETAFSANNNLINRLKILYDELINENLVTFSWNNL